MAKLRRKADDAIYGDTAMKREFYSKRCRRLYRKMNVGSAFYSFIMLAITFGMFYFVSKDEQGLFGMFGVKFFFEILSFDAVNKAVFNFPYVYVMFAGVILLGIEYIYLFIGTFTKKKILDDDFQLERVSRLWKFAVLWSTINFLIALFATYSLYVADKVLYVPASAILTFLITVIENAVQKRRLKRFFDADLNLTRIG